MSLRVVYIKKEVSVSQEVKDFADRVLTPKWDKMGRELAQKLFEKEHMRQASTYSPGKRPAAKDGTLLNHTA